MSDWISIEDRFPDKGEAVLVYCTDEENENMGPLISTYDPENYTNNWSRGEDDWLAIDMKNLKVTHWHPLPKPPPL